MAMPGEVETVYRTTDGQVWDTLEEANDHQEGLNLKQEFGELFDATTPVSSLQKGAVINWLIEYAEEIQAIYDGGDFEPAVVE